MRRKSLRNPRRAWIVERAAVQKALGFVVAQANQLLARRRHRVAVAVQFANAGIVEPARLVEADQHLIGPHDHARHRSRVGG